MSLAQTVADLVREAGKATVESLAQELPEFTKGQIMAALQFAIRTKRVRTKGKAGLPGKRNRACEYEPGEVQPKQLDDDVPPHRGTIPKVSSVFDLGQTWTRQT